MSGTHDETDHFTGKNSLKSRPRKQIMHQMVGKGGAEIYQELEELSMDRKRVIHQFLGLRDNGIFTL